MLNINFEQKNNTINLQSSTASQQYQAIESKYYNHATEREKQIMNELLIKVKNMLIEKKK